MVTLRNIIFIAAFFGPALASTNGEVIPGSYIVTLKSTLSSTDAEVHLEWVDDLHKRSLSKRDSDKGVERTYDAESGFKGYSGTFDEKTVKKIKKHSDVASVEPNRVWKANWLKARKKRIAAAEEEERDIDVRDGLNEVTQRPSVWGLGAVSHRKSGFRSYIYDSSAGTGTYAYLVDTGVRTTHTEFGGRASAAWTAWPGNYNDTVGHGTHVAGTIAGKTYGVAKNAQVLAVKVFLGEDTSTAIVLSGYNWAVSDIISKNRTGAAIINMSLGGSYSPAFNNAVENAYQSGVTTVVAAGNSYANVASTSPASAPDAITVGAIDSNWNMAYFTNWGSGLDIFAPGVGITSAWYTSDTATNTIDGTSMACPHVSGLVLYAFSVDGIQQSGLVSWLKSTGTSKKVRGNLRGSPNLIGNNGNWLQGPNF